jgi:alpha-galactosidase
MRACYNTWWTLTAADQQPEATMALMRTFKEKLFDAHGVFFDLVATDAGWSDQRAIWQIDRQKLPHGFRDVRTLVESAGGKLGLWISPSETYL